MYGVSTEFFSRRQPWPKGRPLLLLLKKNHYRKEGSNKKKLLDITISQKTLQRRTCRLPVSLLDKGLFIFCCYHQSKTGLI